MTGALHNYHTLMTGTFGCPEMFLPIYKALCNRYTLITGTIVGCQGRVGCRDLTVDGVDGHRCPSADCPYVAHSCTDSRDDAQDITCECGATFCFRCKEEAHRPVRFPTLFLYLYNLAL